MKILKQLLFAAAFLLVGFSTMASAQKDGDKNPPPKKDPPVIIVKDKDREKPKEEKPKEEKKKPQASVFIVKEERMSE
jgi:hypothetical protein